MSNVHEAITAHSKKQNAIVTKFAALEEKREALIEKAVMQCRQSEPFSVNGINEVTAEINELAKQGIIPTRQHVTEEMVKEYVQRKFGQDSQ
ncbi:YpbS family protein [Metabacillus indicus]|uniref:YpbS family protein n=1 Tax=Metabacillus indicus TaxID=246786 RepID=UPI002A08D26F|nr:YpbS family protein [Metabacillus indicus]MDX8291707.1 YpbS family protein [Metabacillus indicus]